MEGQWLILVLMGLYFVGILAVSRVFSRKIADLRDFFLAGRSLGMLPVAFTFVASWFGATSTVAALNVFNAHGLSGLWELAIPSVLSCLVITFLIARRVARLQKDNQSPLSQPEAVEAVYGRTGRLILSVVILSAVTALLGAQLVAGGQLFKTILGLDLWVSTLVMTLVVVIYAMLGGYFAVVVTDMAQLFLIVLALLVLLGFGFGWHLMSGTPLIEVIEASRGVEFWSLSKDIGRYAFLVLTFVLGWCIAPEMWQRMSSSRSEQEAFRSALVASVILILLFVLVFAIGMYSVAIVPPSEQVLVDLALTMHSPILSALVLTGVTAAISSTMDSSINVGSLTLTRDVYQGYLRPQASNRELLWVGRMGTVLMVIPAVCLALYFQDIIRVLWVSADIYASMMFVPIICLLYQKRPSRLGGVLAMAMGGSMVVLSALNQYELIDLSGLLGFHWPQWPYSTLIGVGVSAAGMVLGRVIDMKTGAQTDC